MNRRVLALLGLVLAAACAADSSMIASSAPAALSIATITMQAGDSIPAPVTATFDGVERVPASGEFILSSSDTGVIVIAPNGALVGVGIGVANITAKWIAAPGITASRSIAIISERLAAVTLVAPVRMIAGAATPLSVVGRISANRVVPRPVSVVISSRNPAVVAIRGDTATAVATGSTWIVALASSGVSDSSFIIVAARTPSPPISDGGYAQVRWVGEPPSAPVAAAFEAARLRINGLFRSFGNVAATPVQLGAEACMAGTSALGETVPGILIFAQVSPIDGVGNILGSAGPCLVRSSSRLPVIAAMQFDVADMSAMIGNGSLNGVVLHEMMHTLGFGTIWGPDEQGEVALPGGTDPRYAGSVGVAEYAALGAADAASGAPVENTGGTGTRGSHWRESVFRSELMTGWADGSLPMSRVTIGALKDFGYDVDLNRADPFTLSISPARASLRAPQRIVEQTLTPIGTVDPNGRISPDPGPVVH